MGVAGGLSGDLMAFLGDEAAGSIDHYVNSGRFSGGSFDTYGHNHAKAITADDLIAVTMLSIRVQLKTNSGITPFKALAIEKYTGDISALLSRVPSNHDLHTVRERDYAGMLGEHSPAWRLWSLLRDKDRVGLPSVVSHKLLARKRPRLIPVFDGVIEDELNPSGSWSTWWNELTARPELVSRLEEVRAEANATWLSLLRVADIAVWMARKGADAKPPG